MQDDLELKQRAAEENELQGRFDRRLKLLQLREHRRDRDLKALEIEHAKSSGLRFTSAQATIAAAILALASAVAGGLIQASMTRDVESDRNTALIETEKLRAQASIDLEIQKQMAAERIEQASFESTLILKAIEALSREDQVRNLKFFLNAGFISDSDGKIAAMDEDDLPSLPALGNPIEFPALTLGNEISEGEISELIDEIVRVSGLKRSFIALESDRAGGVFSINSDGKYYLLINMGWLSSFYEPDKENKKWVQAYILAHEIGHIFLDHLNDSAISNRSRELEADEFSGQILRRLNAPKGSWLPMAGRIFAENGTQTYPARFARIAAINAGWNKASIEK